MPPYLAYGNFCWIRHHSLSLGGWAFGNRIWGRSLHVPDYYLSGGTISLRVPASAPCPPWGLEEEGVGGLSFRLEEVYVFQSTGGSGLCERLTVIVGWGCEGPACTFTSCCTGGPGGFRKLPGLWATQIEPRESRRKKKGHSCL